MANVFGVLAFVVFIAVVIAAAAGITWVVVELSPPKTQPPPGDAKS